MSQEAEVIERLEDQLAREENAATAAESLATESEPAPDPGFSRQEALKRKAAKLMAEAEELRAQLEIETADPRNVKVEREVRQAINDDNEVFVSNADPNYRYAWVFRDARGDFGGRFVRRLQVLGWEVVSGDMKEATEHRYVDGTRVVADCLLMRCRIDRYVVLQKRDRLLREAQQAGVYAEFFDVADRAGVRVWEELPQFIADGMRDTADQRRVRALAQFHRMNRTGGMDRMLKGGGIPGLPPGVRRVAGPGRQG